MRWHGDSLALASLATLALVHVPVALAHGGDEMMDMPESHEQNGTDEMPAEAADYPPTYFAHPEHVALLYAHIVLMVLAWVFALPVAVMLSLVKYRYTLFAQVAFMALNGVGVLLATIYNARTPDLYPNNAHHSVGWVVTWIALAQFTVSLLSWVARRARGRAASSPTGERNAFLPLTTMMRRNDQTRNYMYSGEYRRSSDEAESSSNSHRSSSASTVIDDGEAVPLAGYQKEYEDDDDGSLEQLDLDSSRVQGTWTRRAVAAVSSKVWAYFTVAYRLIDRIILPLGFIALASGVATLGRFFEGKAIFNGLAHWVKGGVFFWLGLFTLGRWSGSFGDLGWAWNVRPRSASSKWRPSAEFVESALIFFYGSTNVFMEHLGHWGGKWHPQDFEHLSITILFMGGGLCGMLIESTRIRGLLNVSTMEELPERAYSDDEERGEREEPATYSFSLNPIPALVILLLGTMMGSHHQSSMISTMIHKQWGNLLVGASFARGLTYVLIFLRPPTSVMPSRPPTELLASFALIAGGIIFMASSSDTILGMIHYELDAMFMYTVTMGLVGLLMAWEIIVLAIKGLAARSERR
jgi:hypothetical protein